MSEKNRHELGNFLRSKVGVTLLVFLAIGAFLLVSEHRAHIFTSNGFLALLLIVCVGMHFFMHGGHGGKPAGGDGRKDYSADSRGSGDAKP